MTQKEILDYNKLCAEFLGWKFSQNYENFDEYYYRWNKENDGVWYRDEDFVENPESFDAYYVKVNGICLKKYLYTLKFDSDWNWIMEVKQEICQLDIVDEFNTWYDSVAKGYQCSITPSYKDTFDGFYTKICHEEKEAVVQAINQFLIWHNNEIKKI